MTNTTSQRPAYFLAVTYFRLSLLLRPPKICKVLSCVCQNPSLASHLASFTSCESVSLTLTFSIKVTLTYLHKVLSYICNCKELNVLPMSPRFDLTDLMLLFKIIHGMSPLKLPSYLRFFTGTVYHPATSTHLV